MNREFDMSAPVLLQALKRKEEGEKKQKRRLEAEKFFEGALTHPHIVFFFDTVNHQQLSLCPLVPNHSIGPLPSSRSKAPSMTS